MPLRRVAFRSRAPAATSPWGELEQVARSEYVILTAAVGMLRADHDIGGSICLLFQMSCTLPEKDAIPPCD
ncbi:hypothetical protein C8J45_101703 [Sphingomonas sp. PP-CE-3G-477]|uniref:hypothetical protein n=1 Tax=Sphingomonas sp. PP-CE-3G-477 TaxID=2135660 RepID=UPI000D33F621|nr:hypothetical protein [Sphingomonas sp. PP-CE-3G-477]PTQ65844.1 hypothetical protein C8J45_101703 [Sphingomonas sp. PP-CE-3G-477]